MSSDKPGYGILKKDVIVQATGFRRKAGMGVSSAEVPPHLWQAWVDEGIVNLYPEPDLPGTPKGKAQARRRVKEKKVL